MEIGRKIKELRKLKNITQEELAIYLNITTQAISKWENEINSPDIELLPKISAYFGITIDELFSITDDIKFDRIKHLLNYDLEISYEKYIEYEEFLLDNIYRVNNNDEIKLLSYELLSWLYLNKVDEFKVKTREISKEGLKIFPDSKTLHASLNDGERVPAGDWNIYNNANRIDYYNKFIKENPKNSKGYYYLLDSLLNDGRIDEGKEVLERYILNIVDEDAKWKALSYNCKIDLKEGNYKKGMEILNEIIDKYSNLKGANFEIANIYAYRGDWDKALIFYNRSFELSEKPRDIDELVAMSRIYKIQGKDHMVEEILNNYIDILKLEWNLMEESIIDKLKNSIL